MLAMLVAALRVVALAVDIAARAVLGAGQATALARRHRTVGARTAFATVDPPLLALQPALFALGQITLGGAPVDPLVLPVLAGIDLGIGLNRHERGAHQSGKGSNDRKTTHFVLSNPGFGAGIPRLTLCTGHGGISCASPGRANVCRGDRGKPARYTARMTIPVAMAAAVIMIAPWQAAAQGLTGTWSTESGCAAHTRRLTFLPSAMELREGARRLFASDVAYEADENRTSVTILRIESRPPQPGQPQAGDVLVFRRERQHLYLEDHRRQGRTIARLDGVPPLYRCP